MNGGNVEIKFIADEMLGKLAKWLRTLGYDTLYHRNGDDIIMVQKALEEDRIILTRDTHISEIRLARKVMLIKSSNTWEQLKQVVNELKLDTKSNLFTRCIVCNELLSATNRESVRAQVPMYVYLTQTEFYTCPSCRKVYWQGTHKDFMSEKLIELGFL